jgi:hypothetical protein
MKEPPLQVFKKELVENRWFLGGYLTFSNKNIENPSHSPESVL